MADINSCKLTLNSEGRIKNRVENVSNTYGRSASMKRIFEMIEDKLSFENLNIGNVSNTYGRITSMKSRIFEMIEGKLSFDNLSNLNVHIKNRNDQCPLDSRK